MFFIASKCIYINNWTIRILDYYYMPYLKVVVQMACNFTSSIGCMYSVCRTMANPDAYIDNFAITNALWVIFFIISIMITIHIASATTAEVNG